MISKAKVPWMQMENSRRSSNRRCDHGFTVQAKEAMTEAKVWKLGTKIFENNYVAMSISWKIDFIYFHIISMCFEYSVVHLYVHLSFSWSPDGSANLQPLRCERSLLSSNNLIILMFSEYLRRGALNLISCKLQAPMQTKDDLILTLPQAYFSD